MKAMVSASVPSPVPRTTPMRVASYGSAACASASLPATMAICDSRGRRRSEPGAMCFLASKSPTRAAATPSPSTVTATLPSSSAAKKAVSPTPLARGPCAVTSRTPTSSPPPSRSSPSVAAPARSCAAASSPDWPCSSPAPACGPRPAASISTFCRARRTSSARRWPSRSSRSSSLVHRVKQRAEHVGSDDTVVLLDDLAVAVDDDDRRARLRVVALDRLDHHRIVVVGAVDLDELEALQLVGDLVEGLHVHLFAGDAPVGVEVEQRRLVRRARRGHARLLAVDPGERLRREHPRDHAEQAGDQHRHGEGLAHDG